MNRPSLFSSPASRKALIRFAVLFLSALALQGVPLLFLLMEGDAGVTWYLIHLYAVIPLCALLIPLWAGMGGVHPLAAFFPIGGALLILPVYESPKIALLCMALSLVGCVAGREWQNRKTAQKGNHHGGKARKK